MTHDTHPTRSSDPDDTLRQALQCLATEQGMQDADALGRRVMVDWRREVTQSASDAHQLRFVETPAGFRRYGRRQIGVTALFVGIAVLFVVWIKLHDLQTQQLTQVDVLSEMSLGGL